jgi:hypothetical protein
MAIAQLFPVILSAIYLFPPKVGQVVLLIFIPKYEVFKG